MRSWLIAPLLLTLAGCTFSTRPSYSSSATNVSANPLSAPAGTDVPNTRFAIFPTPAEGPRAQPTLAYPLSRQLGAGGGIWLVPWEGHDGTPGVRQSLSNGGRIVGQTSRQLGMPFLLDFAIVMTNRSRIPGPNGTTLEVAQADTAQVVSMFAADLEALLRDAQGPTGFSEAVDYLAIGNEVDFYLDAQQGCEAWNKYADIFSGAAAAARQRLPRTRVGVDITIRAVRGFIDHSARCWDALRRIHDESQVAIANYYPAFFPPGLEALGPRQQADLGLRQMVQYAQGYTSAPPPGYVPQPKPLVIQEIGYPSSTLVGASEQKQAEFVDQMFTTVEQIGPQIERVAWFSLHDWYRRRAQEPATCHVIDDFRAFSRQHCPSATPLFTAPMACRQQFVAAERANSRCGRGDFLAFSYMVPDNLLTPLVDEEQRFNELLGTNGLLDPEGRPKPAASVFRQRALRRN